MISFILLVCLLLPVTLADNIGPYLQECYLGPGSLETSICTVNSLGFPTGYYLSGKRHASLVRLSETMDRRDVQIQVLFDDLDLHQLSNITFHSGPSENATRYQFTVRGRHRLLHYFTDPVVIVLFSAGFTGNDVWCNDHVGFKARFALVRTSKRLKMPPFRVDTHFISGLYDQGFVDEPFPHPNRAQSWVWYTDTTWIIKSPRGFGTYAKIVNLVPNSVNSETYLEARAGNNSEAPLVFRKSRHSDLQITRWRGAIDIVSGADLYIRFHGMTDQSRYFKMIYTTFYSVLKSNASCEEVFDRELSMAGFYCKRQSQCIPRRYVCDSLPHCVEGYDEYGTVCDAVLDQRMSLCTDGRPFRCPTPDLRCVYSLNECHQVGYYDIPSDCIIGNCTIHDGFFDLGGPIRDYPRWRSYFVVQWLFVSLLSLVAMGLCVIYFGYRQRFIVGGNPAYSITATGLSTRSLGSTSATLSATHRGRRNRQVTLVFYDAFRDDGATQHLTEHQETNNRSAVVVSPPPYVESDRPPSYHSERPELPPAYDQPFAPLNRVKPPSYAEAVGT